MVCILKSRFLLIAFNSSDSLNKDNSQSKNWDLNSILEEKNHQINLLTKFTSVVYDKSIKNKTRTNRNKVGNIIKCINPNEKRTRRKKLKILHTQFPVITIVPTIDQNSPSNSWPANPNLNTYTNQRLIFQISQCRRFPKTLVLANNRQETTQNPSRIYSLLINSFIYSFVYSYIF